MLSALRRCADGVVRSEDLSAVASALAEVAADVSGELFAADLSRIRNRVAFTLRCLRPTSDVDIIHGTATADDSFEALAFEDSQCNLPENATGNDVVRCVTNALNNLLDSAFDANLDHADGITRIRIFCIRIVWVTCKQLTVIGTEESCSVKSDLLDFADVYLDRASDHITISLGQSPHVAELRVINTAIRCLVKLAKGQEAAALAKEFQVDFKQDWPKTAGELFLLWVSGNVHYIGGNFCAAKASFDLCIKGFRKIHSVALPAHYLNQLACTFSKLKKHETALLYFQAVLERNSQSTEALVGLSRSLRILQHREGERKVLTLIIKKEVANLQTMSNEPKQIRSLFILALRLSCLLDARSAAAMFSNLFSLFILNNSLPDVQGICDIPDISMLRRIYSLICLRASKRNRARTLARALLLDNADDVIAGVVIGRCAVLGKQISSSCSENIRVSEDEWHSGEEANYGEEDFSIFEAEKIVDGTVRLLRLLIDGRNASVEHISERCVPNSLQEDIRMKWLFCDPQRVRMLLTETLVNLSIIKWMLGKYGESQSLAVDAYVLSPKIDTVVQNLAVIYWRLGRVKDATQIWLQRRLPELQGIQTVVGTLRKEFWESVGQSIVCGMGLREAVQSEMRQRPRGILRELWDAQQGAGAAEENAQAHAHAPSRWLDVQCARALCEENDKDVPTLQELKNQLEKGTDETKVDTMKKILRLMMNGDPLPGLLMHVIRFVLPSRSKALKKLLLVYWEICPRLGPDGKLKAEMRLMCHALRNDLQHPNEYIRGNTLRLLCKFQEDELLEPCVPPVRACLEHRHSYVRKNAILAIYYMYKNFEHLIPDAPELIHNYIQTEADPNCKRNAFVMLMNTNQALAVDYLSTQFDVVQRFDEVLQQAAIELIRKDCRNPNADKAKYIQCVFSLLQSSAPAVKYEAANTLMLLTSHATAVKAAASCYIELIAKVSDNNVKLIVLDRLIELREKHDRILDDLVMDILRVLTSPDIDVRKKVLGVAMDMTSSRNVDEVVAFLKKELLKTQDQDSYEKNAEYRQLLVHAIHTCAIKFSEVAANVVYVLMEFLGDSGGASAVDVVAFVREVMEKFPHLRPAILDQLLESFKDMKTSRVFRGALWIVGEYTLDIPAIESAMKSIRQSLGEVPILASEQRMLEESMKDEPAESEPKSAPILSAPTAARRILADGTYATESAFSNVTANAKLEAHIKSTNKPPLRSLILGGDYFVAAALAAALTKMVLRHSELVKSARGNPQTTNSLRSEVMLIMTSIIRVGKSEFSASPIDEDSNERVDCCLRVLSGVYGDALNKVFLDDTRRAFSQLMHSTEKKNATKDGAKKKAVKSEADDLIVFRHLKGKKGLVDLGDAYDLDLSIATGQGDKMEDLASKLNRVVQLTGFSDPVYAEAYVTVHQYDILMDILIFNQTNETLQNLTVEFNTMGDLKLVERPSPQTIGPHGFHSLKANIKVSSTETGIIFGNIVYDGPSAVDMNCVILSDIHIDIMDYIKPATCTETQFRAMWTEFEWENKVNVNTNMTDLREYLEHMMKSTNMNCLTPNHALSGDCGFLAANLYARSIFGEDALANICLEVQSQGSSAISGHIRIRSKTQGIALSLGDKITLSQKVVAAV